MEKEEESEPKKETACLFYNFNTHDNQPQISAQIKLRNKKIKDICNELNAKIEQFYSSSNDKYMKNNFKYYKLFWDKYLSHKNIKPQNVVKKIKKNHLGSKIYFGSFFNQNSRFDGTEGVKKYESMKKIISKSSNFSFIKDPKSIKFTQLPLDLYLSKEDSLKLKDLISVKKIFNDKKEDIINRNTSFRKNILFTKNNNRDEDEENEELNEEIEKKILNLKMNNNIVLFNNINKKKKNDIKYILTKNKSSNNSSKSLLAQITQTNSTDFINTQNKTQDELENFPASILKYKYLDKKNKSYSDLSKTYYISSNIIKNNSSSNLYNRTYNQNFNIIHKNSFFSQIQEKLNKISKYRTPKKDIKDLSNTMKLKCRRKKKKITKLINKNIYKDDPKLLMRLLKEKQKKGNKKKNRNQFYYDMKNQIRLLSIVDNLKNMKENAPVNLITHLNRDYYEKSKDMIVDNKVTKQIKKIYRSSTEGKIINEKVYGKSQYINKFVSKNHMDVVKLKNKFEKFDKVVKEILIENDVSNNYKIQSWINKIKNEKKNKKKNIKVDI